MRVALDTCILAYAEGVGDAARCAAAIRLIDQLPSEVVLLPAQTLGELFRVLTRKGNREPGPTREAVMTWADSFDVADSSWSAFQSAMDLATDHHLQIWDALIMAVAAEHRCRVLVSEDLQHGLLWRGVTVINPFVDPFPALLENVLQTG